MFGRSRVSERSSGFRILAACIIVTNARQRNAMPADAFLANDRIWKSLNIWRAESTNSISRRNTTNLRLERCGACRTLSLRPLKNLTLFRSSERRRSSPAFLKIRVKPVDRPQINRVAGTRPSFWPRHPGVADRAIDKRDLATLSGDRGETSSRFRTGQD